MKILFAFFASAALSLTVVSPSSAAQAAESVPCFAPHEVSLTATGTYGNPYVELAADATLTEPDGRATRTLPLFWDGGANWKLRFAPDKPGRWKWIVKSADRGLDGRTGEFECVASKRRGSLQPRAGASRHFQYQNGEPMWFMGDTAWAYVVDSAEEKHDRAAAERYLSNRAAQGFNAIHLMLLNEAGWGNGGGAPWEDMAREKLNPGYFAEADRRIAFANARGIVTGIAVAWGNKRNEEPYSWGRMTNLAARQRFARYAAARYGAYDVYFLVSGEWSPEIRTRKAPEAEVRREFIQIGDALHAADAHRRMIGIHPGTQHGSVRQFNSDSAWMDFGDYQQNYAELHERVLASRSVGKPVVNSEYGYYLRDQNGDGKVDKPHSLTVDDMRHATWDLVMAGAYVVTGFGSTYMGGYRHPTTFLPDDPKNVPWAEQMGRMKKFFDGLEYWKLEPRDETLSGAAARSAERTTEVEQGAKRQSLPRTPATTYWCLADESGRTHVVYVRGTKEPVAVNVGGAGEAKAATWSATRFDPRSGKSESAAIATEAGKVRLSAPDERDWVFVLRTAGGPTAVR